MYIQSIVQLKRMVAFNDKKSKAYENMNSDTHMLAVDSHHCMS